MSFKFTSMLVFVCASALISGCGTSSGVKRQDQSTHTITVIEYFVQPRDTLSGIARKLTGNRDNWREIGRFNGISNPSRIKVGDALLVPEHMLNVDIILYERSTLTLHLGPVDTNNQLAETSNEATSAIAGVSSNSGATRRNGFPPVFQAEALPGQRLVLASMSPVEVNRHFDVTYFDRLRDTNTRTTTRSIRVIGTYYPKGIYSEPTSSSSLLMRVAPGTQFEFEQDFGDWLKIRTDSGVGFIHKRDAQINGSLEQANSHILTSSN